MIVFLDKNVLQMLIVAVLTNCKRTGIGKRQNVVVVVFFFFSLKKNYYVLKNLIFFGSNQKKKKNYQKNMEYQTDKVMRSEG